MKFLHRDNLTFSFEERGLQFVDGIYDVIRIYEGNYYLLNEHIDCLLRSDKSIKIHVSVTKEECRNYLLELLKQNKMQEDGKVYLQVTLGSAPRDHVFPEEVQENMY